MVEKNYDHETIGTVLQLKTANIFPEKCLENVSKNVSKMSRKMFFWITRHELTYCADKKIGFTRHPIFYYYYSYNFSTVPSSFKFPNCVSSSPFGGK